MLPAFSTRRRLPVTCTNCGQRLEIVYPKPWYYTLSLAAGLLVELSVLPLLFLIILQQWVWFAAVIAAFTLGNYLSTAFLNARATIRVDTDPLDEGSSRELLGRWYPKYPPVAAGSRSGAATARHFRSRPCHVLAHQRRGVIGPCR